MASRSASRMVWLTVSVPAGTSGSAARGAGGADASGDEGAAGGGEEDFAAAGGCAAFATGGGGEGALAGAPAPSPSSTAIGVFTFTPSVPAGMSSLDTLPSSEASTSMVALSVSISAMTSPALMVWPSSTSHLASLPSSMVGDSAGISISVGISSGLLSLEGVIPLASTMQLVSNVCARGLTPMRLQMRHLRFDGLRHFALLVAGVLGGGRLDQHDPAFLGSGRHVL